MSAVASSHERTARLVRRVLAVLAIGAFVLWWQWPVLAGYDDRLDVLAASDPLLVTIERPLALQVRAEGKTFLRMDDAASSCDAAALHAEVARLDPQTVVLTAGDACDVAPLAVELRTAGRTVVVLVEPGADVQLERRRIHAVHIAEIVGGGQTHTVRPCEWWDDAFLEPCGDDGVAVLRDDTGAITFRGGDRIGRAVVARLS